MSMNRRSVPRRLGFSSASGFSMIEVLVALVVLAIGLLGFALLQTMNLRFTQSANHRTQAINLSSDLLDQMRANRNDSAWYARTASFTPGSVAPATCSRPTGPVTYVDNVARWKCQVVATLGADAGVVADYDAGVVRLAIDWGDGSWNPDSATNRSVYSVETRL